jgi:hypothetical protein
MKISMDDVFPIMASAVSGLEATEEDWKEHGAYTFLADIRHFLCVRAGPRVETQLQEFGLLLENLLSNGDNDIHDLVLDSLEGLLDCDRRDSVARFFGPKTLELWSQVRRTVP